MDHIETSKEQITVGSRVVKVSGLILLFAIAVLLGQLAWQGLQKARTTPSRITGSYDVYFENVEMGLIVYTSNTCPVCDKTKVFLSKSGVVFEEREIQQDSQWIQHLRALGISSVPVLMFRDELIIGFEDSEIQRALDRHDLL